MLIITDKDAAVCKCKCCTHVLLAGRLIYAAGGGCPENRDKVLLNLDFDEAVQQRIEQAASSFEKAFGTEFKKKTDGLHMIEFKNYAKDGRAPDNELLSRCVLILL